MIFALTIISCTAYNFAFAWKNNLKMILDTGNVNVTNDYYFVPWTRIAPYVIGVLLGIFYKNQKNYEKRG